MHIPIRRRLSYANVAATLALVLSMSGGALAASKYLINSTKQINPKVLKKLKGNTGPRGATGATGGTGTAGSAGKEGPPGKEGSAGKNGVGTPLFFKAAAGTGPTVIATLDGAQILAECNSKTEAIVSLHPTANFGVLHGWYNPSNKGIEVLSDETKIGEDDNLQGGATNDWEGWFSYLGPNGGISTAIFGDDSGGSHSKQCLVWGNLNNSSTGSTGGV
ncbi:MAG: hypothetical protein M3Z95_09260 [Actinomycetota bacterium]|nr:hypothetical protein [Actinomycetota bacterium]